MIDELWAIALQKGRAIAILNLGEKGISLFFYR